MQIVIFVAEWQSKRIDPRFPVGQVWGKGSLGQGMGEGSLGQVWDLGGFGICADVDGLSLPHGRVHFCRGGEKDAGVGDPKGCIPV